MSRTGRVLATLVVVAGLTSGIIVYFEARGSSDGQILLGYAGVMFWTLLALFVVWILDRLFAGTRRR